jgi:SAM-dependent methyltransferase
MKKIIEVFKKAERFFYRALRLLPFYKFEVVYINGNKYFKYRGNFYPEYLNKGNAKSFIEYKALKYCLGKGIDVGAGDWPLKGAMAVREEERVNAYKLDIFNDDSLDFVFSSHCLEHLYDWRKALILWIKKIKKGGILFLYLPHESMLLWHPHSPWVREDHKWILRANEIVKFLRKNQIEIEEFSDRSDIYWSFFVVGRKI